MKKCYSSRYFIIFSFVFTIVLQLHARAQITTRRLTPNEIQKFGIKEIVSVDQLPTKRLPAVDLNTELRTDSLNNILGRPYRFGKSFTVDVDILKEGRQFQSADSIITNYVISSQSATSLNLVFDRFKLAKGTKLFIYSADKKFLYGPVTEANNSAKGTFWTDVLPGSSIVIQIISPGLSVDKSEIHLTKAVHGYSTAQFSGFGQSAACNRDIACPEGNNWRDEGSSVAMLLVSVEDDADGFCSGALVNNTCQNLRPFFLTAFHCLDVNQDGNLDAGEMAAVGNWVFRFNYDSPSCSGSEPSPTSWLTFNGSDFRSGFFNTDFALLELDRRPEPGDNISYSGWSRASTAATSAVSIHHPSGDVKKISVDNNALTNVGIQTVWRRDPFGNPLLTAPANTHWETVFETGTVQHGSSGAPIFNQNGLIVGQLHGDHLTTGNFCADRRGQYGRFDVSWDGGGTNQTRLSNWLDPNGTGATDQGSFMMPTISGLGILCTTGQYILNNIPAGVPVTWSVSTPASVTPSSGSGTIANLTMVTPEDVTITFSIGCDGTGIVSRRLLVGPPQFGGFLVNGNSTSNATACVNNYIPIAAVPNDPSSSYYWSQSDPNGFIANSSSSSTAFTAYNVNCYYLNVNIWNSCGSVNQTLTICTNNCFARYTVFPNPAQDYLTIKFDEIESSASLPERIILLSENTGGVVKSIDVRNAYERKEFKNGKELIIDAKDLPRGVYYLHISNDQLSENKLDVIRILLE